MQNRKSIRVLLVDDHAVVRNGLRVMLSSAADIVVANEAENMEDALQLVRAEKFDVALLDIAMPKKNGLELLKALRAEMPGLAVLILSMYAEEMYAVRALKLGAAGYLTKNAPAATLIAAVRKAAAGGKYITPGTADQFARMLSGDSAVPHECLSDRELEVLKLLAAGETSARIAEILCLSQSTVTTYRARICEKMGLKSNSELTRYALVNGLLL
jgi:DNA-binding NarL/FixJ family response regulator